MKKTTIEKIKNNHYYKGKDTIIGKYTYRVNENTGKIKRCKTEEIGKEWITWDGKQIDGWEEV